MAVQTSSLIATGEFFLSTDPFTTNVTIYVNPFDYSYLAEDSPLVAHEMNMALINEMIHKRAAEAIARIDQMVDEMNDPVVKFEPHVEAIENEDGTYTFIYIHDKSVILEEPKQDFDTLDYIERSF